MSVNTFSLLDSPSTSSITKNNPNSLTPTIKKYKDMKIAIYGAGSLGVVLGAYLAKSGLSVDLIPHNPEHVNALNTNGAKVIGTTHFCVPVTALLPEEMTSGYDFIILLTKQHHNTEIAMDILPLLKADGVLCTLQNGLPEPELAEIVGETHLIGGIVSWGATLQAPGVSELTSMPHSMSFKIGRINGSVDDKLLALKEILELMCPTSISANILIIRWNKLLINASCSGLSAVLGCTFGEVIENKLSRQYALHIIKECIDIARASGIDVTKTQDGKMAKMFYFNHYPKYLLTSLLIRLAIKPHKLLKASMLQDLEKGKACEVDYINGSVCAYGKRLHIPTPYNDQIVEIIHGIENHEYTFNFANLDLLLPVMQLNK